MASVSLLCVSAGMAGCTATATPGLLRQEQGGVTVVPAPQPLPAPPPYVAYRPIYSRLLQPKTLVLGNYAGANYPSIAPGAVLTPTDFRVLTGRAVQPY
jgi:hypothetical protein